MLTEGTDMKYGARHLKRAIERLLVQPMSNLIATDQVRGGDWIRVDFDEANKNLCFAREAEGLPVAGHGPTSGHVGDDSAMTFSQRRYRRAGADAERPQFKTQLIPC